jgi:uncharacterized phiE125 gp8 family phage protein
MERWSLQLATPPASSPISLTEAKSHLNIDHSSHDTLIQAYIDQAVDYTQRFCERTWFTCTWALRLDRFPPWEIKLPRPPAASVSSIAYIDALGASQTLSASTYLADIYSNPGIVTPAPGYSWPVTQDRINAVTVTYVAGTAAASVPDAAKAAIRLLVGHFFENREAVVTGTIAVEVPMTVKNLLWSVRSGRF